MLATSSSCAGRSPNMMHFPTRPLRWDSQSGDRALGEVGAGKAGAGEMGAGVE